MLKKILIFYPSFESGGATKNLIRIVNYLLKKKIAVILLSHKVKKTKFTFIKNLQIPVIDMVKEINLGVTDPLSLYSTSCGHFNVKGYKFLSELIYKNTN